MLSKYIVIAIFEYEINAITEELNVCIDALASLEMEDTDGGIIDKLSYAKDVLNRMYNEIKKL